MCPRTHGSCVCLEPRRSEEAEALEVELQLVVSCRVELRNGSSGKAVGVFAAEPSPQLLDTSFFEPTTVSSCAQRLSSTHQLQSLDKAVVRMNYQIK